MFQDFLCKQFTFMFVFGIIYSMSTLKHKQKIFMTLIAIVMTIMSAFAILYPITAFADIVIESNGNDIIYHYFHESSAIAYSDSEVYLADNDTIYKYSPSLNELTQTSFKPTDNINKMVIYGDNAFVIQGDNNEFAIYNLNSTTPLTITFQNGNGDSISNAGFEYIAYHNGLVHITKNSTIYKFNGSTFTYMSSSTMTNKIKGIESGNELYVAIQNLANSNFTDIYCLADNNVTTELKTQISGFKDMIFNKGYNILGVLTENYIYTYNAKEGSYEQVHIATDYGAEYICTDGQNFYTFNDNKSISRLAYDLSTATTIIASSSDAYGFYSSPNDIASRSGTYYVADTQNNRVAINTLNNSHEPECSYISLTDPTAVTTDIDNNFYVAYNRRFINAYSSNKELIKEISFELVDSSYYQTINSIRADNLGNLYILTRENKLYKTSLESDSFELVYTGNVYAMGSEIHNAKFYFVGDNTLDPDYKEVFTINSSGEITSTGISDITDFVDLTVDADNSFYTLNTAGVINRYIYNAGYETYTLSANSYTLTNTVEPIKILVSSISTVLMNSNKEVHYRDIFIVDRGLHTIDAISSDWFDVIVESEDTRPTLDGEFNIENLVGVDTARIIYKVTAISGAMLYTNSSDIYPIVIQDDEGGYSHLTLDFGHYVIVPEIDEVSGYSLVYADNTKYGNKDEIIIGYIRNSHLSESLEYDTPSDTSCKITYTTGIYKYPSSQSTVYDNYSSLEVNKTLTLMDFTYSYKNDILTYGYTDNMNLRWYRIKFEHNSGYYIGYINANFVSINDADPNPDIMPKTDATIVSNTDDPDDGAIVYFMDSNGGYVRDTNYTTIAVGTRVEVVGVFDSSLPYTLIKFTASNGTVERYVETSNLVYDGADLVKIIAIILIILTTIFLAVIITRHLRKKRQNINSDIDEEL